MMSSASAIWRTNSGSEFLKRKLPSASSLRVTLSPSAAFNFESASLGRTSPTEFPILRSFSSITIEACYNASNNKASLSEWLERDRFFRLADETIMDDKEALIALNMISHIGPVRLRNLQDRLG